MSDTLEDVVATGSWQDLYVLTGNLKILYRYMLDRYLFFTGLGNEFYDNQDDLAESLAMTRRTIISLIKSLMSAGLVQKRTSRHSGANNSNSYIVQDILDKSRFETMSLVCSMQSVVVIPIKDDFDAEEF